MQDRILAHAVEFGGIVQRGIVSHHEALVLVVGHLDLEQVEAAAFAVRLVGLHVDARELGQIGLDILDVVGRELQEALAERFGEVERQGVRAVEDRNALGDALRAVDDGFVAIVVLGRVERVRQLIDIHLLQDVLLRRVDRRDRIPLHREMETLEFGILAQVEIADDYGDEREGAGAPGQAILRFADGTDGDAVVGIAGQVVGHLLGDAFEGELDRMERIRLRDGHETATEGGVRLHAGKAAECSCRQDEKACLHLKVHRKNCSTHPCSCHLPGPCGRKEGSEARAPCSVPRSPARRAPRPR